MNKNSTRYYSKKQEDRIAKNLNGKRNANSGATRFVKGDVTTKHFLIEAKTSMKPTDSMKIKESWIIKNREEAFAMRKQHAAVSIDFGKDTNYYIIDEKDFKLFISLLDDVQG